MQKARCFRHGLHVVLFPDVDNTIPHQKRESLTTSFGSTAAHQSSSFGSDKFASSPATIRSSHA